MEIDDTGCCAVREINCLSDHTTAQEAMESFCEELIGDGCGNADCKEEGQCRCGCYTGVGNFYTFTGVVKHTDGTTPPLNGAYGPNFKAFILKHRLGTCTETRARRNILNEPTHFVKVWVWSVNRRNLKTWWQRQQKEGAA